MLITIIITAAAAVLIYKIGVINGQSAAQGKRMSPVQNAKHKADKEQERLQQGIKNILDFGMEDKK